MRSIVPRTNLLASLRLAEVYVFLERLLVTFNGQALDQTLAGAASGSFVQCVQLSGPFAHWNGQYIEHYVLQAQVLVSAV